MQDRARVLVVAGTRPEGIKLAPVVTALERHDAEVEVRLALTGQHSDMLQQVLDVFALAPHWDLGIMREGQSLYDVAHGCLDGLRAIVAEYRPQMMLVQGDTASVFFGALVGFFERVQVGHVEAGLRSGDKWQPYPEEVFRRMTGVVADLHFAPTARARRNLLDAGVPDASVFVTGNTVVDALTSIGDARPGVDAAPADAEEERLILLTAHRRESFGAPLREVFRAARDLADAFPDVRIVYPVHPNPSVREPAREILGGHSQIDLIPPLGYFELLGTLRRAALVLTDSGGIQEEAPSFGVPVLVLREVTERPEGVEAGVARLVGTDRERILAAAGDVLRGGSSSGPGRNPYGDGRAAERIADIVVSHLTGRPRGTSDWRAGT